jgi:hypothetical protein
MCLLFLLVVVAHRHSRLAVIAMLMLYQVFMV